MDELGISLINIRSTGFENVGVLFHNLRIRKNCAIITDLDQAFIDLTPNPLDSDAEIKAKKKALGSQTSGAARFSRLNTFCQGNAWLTTHFAQHTFEVDFILVGNSAVVVSVLNEIYNDAGTIAQAKADLESGDIARYGARVLTMANHVGKGWFAIILGKAITPDVHIPQYLLSALFNAHRPISVETLASIFEHRLKWRLKSGPVLNPQIDAMRDHVGRFRRGEIDFSAVRDEMLKAFPDDRINTILATL